MTPINPPTGTVTFLFTDAEASTRKWEHHRVEMQGAMARHDELVRSAIEGAGGFVFTTAGDAFCAAFADPAAAVQAAVDAQLAIAERDWGVLAPFRVRMALHSGNADERGGDYFGPPLNRCARLLSTAHGGQVLVSSATSQLLRDSLPASTGLRDLGAHSLKDLDQDEHVFQVVHAGLEPDFPALRSEAPGPLAELDEARAAFEANAWRRAYDLFAKLDGTTALDTADVERMGEAAHWLGEMDESTRLRERSYAEYSAASDHESAGRQSLRLADYFSHRLTPSVANGWMARAERHLEGLEDTVTYGFLLRQRAVRAEHEGDLEQAVSLADQVLEIGRRLASRDLEALGIQDKGRFLVSQGKIAEGMRLMDEAMAAAVGGELDADTTGRSYCNMLAVCDDVADYQRAGEWVEAAAEWCDNHSDSTYPGVCRIFGAEVKWRRGAWDDAAEEVRRAVSELGGYTDIVGAAWYQLGEIELRAGRLDAAEEMFRTAHEHGRTPIPGLAKLYLMRGDVEAAIELLDEALAATRGGPLARARLLPAWIDSQLASGKPDAAKEAVAELEATCQLTGSVAFDAATARAKGALALAEGRIEDAVGHLQAAVEEWTALKMPYEAADARVLLAEARLARGRRASARLDLEAAKSAFERLGAASDVQRVEALLS